MSGIYTTSEAGELLKLTAGTVAKYANEGRFPGAFKTGINWRIPQESIDEFIRVNVGGKSDPYLTVAPRSRRARAYHQRQAAKH